jgi:hypothetical protein
MSFANPTALKIGMTGALYGQQFRVAGRSVMGVVEDGQTYYWNEFNIVNQQDQSGTLVYEVTESGAEWKLFTLIEPKFPITAQEAALKKVGDTVNLEGTPLPVTLVDESRVYYIEGEGPKGEDVGDVAHYFNAQAGDQMLVASWTGDDIEFYRGMELARGLVAEAFHLPQEPKEELEETGGDSRLPSNVWVTMLLVIALIAIGYLFWANLESHPTAVSVRPAAAATLHIGQAGTLAGNRWRIVGHELVEIDEVGLAYQRHEYQIVDDTEKKALLVCGLKSGDEDWALYNPVEQEVSLTPYQAAAVHGGELVILNGTTARVTELFQSVTRQAESSDGASANQGTILYGFNAGLDPGLWLARWNQDGLSLYAGRVLTAKTISQAFR